MNGDWRVWRPPIWLVMIGIAVMLLVSPWYFGAVFFGAAIGSAIRIRQRRQRALSAAAAAAAAGRGKPKRRGRSGGKR